MVQRTPHRFTADDFDRMIEAGIFGKDDRVELLSGEVIEMSPIGYRHNDIVDRLLAHFAVLAPKRAIVRVQGSLRLDDLSELQPDLMLLSAKGGFYRDANPGPDDVKLLIEVADTTMQYDRDAKLPRYAEAGIAEVWLVDIAEATISVHRDPKGETYGAIFKHAASDTIAPLAYPDCALRVASLFE